MMRLIRQSMGRERRLQVIVLVGALAGAAALLVSSAALSTKEAHAVALGIVGHCKEAKYAPACYEEEIPALLDAGTSMEDVILVTREVLKLDHDYTYCHVVGHKIAAKETAKDPARWQEVASRSPIDLCSYGFIHGAFQERFRTEAMPDASAEEVRAILGDICGGRTWTGRTEGERTNCMHAVGHLLMYITAADLHRATDICESIGMTGDGIDMRRMCFEGAFMQMFQPLEPDDFALIEGKAPKTIGERDALCGEFQGIRRSTCIKESWPLDLKAVYDPKRVSAFCAYAGGGDAAEEEYCISATSYLAAARSQFDPEKFAAYCRGIEDGWAATCFRYGAPRFFEIYGTNFAPPLSLCAEAEALGEGDKCYQLLSSYSTRTFQAGSKEALSLCDALPERWREDCLYTQTHGSLPPGKPL